MTELPLMAVAAIGWLLLRHAALALEQQKTATGSDKAFYEGKIASARFFSREVLPNVGLAMRHVQNSTLLAMEVSEDAF